MPHAFNGQTANELWLNAAGAFNDATNYRTHCGRGGETQEMLNVSLELTDPQRRWVSSRTPAINIAFALVEVVWILRGRNDAGFLNYFNRTLPQFAGGTEVYHGAYGHRLLHANGLNQLERAYHALRCNPETRQIVLQIWQSSTDLPDIYGEPMALDIPCNLLSLLKIRDGCLEWTQIMRSNDLFLGFVHNVVQFTCLQEIFAGWLGVKLGRYYHYSDSLHVYTRDLLAMQKSVLQDCPAGTDSLMLDKALSCTMFAKLEKLIEMLIDSTCSTKDILSFWASFDKPISIHNLGTIILCEGLRRRSEKTAMFDMLAGCTNPEFDFMFRRWLKRVGEPGAS